MQATFKSQMLNEIEAPTTGNFLKTFKLEPEFEYDDKKGESSPLGGVSVIAIGDPHFKIHTLTEMKTYVNRVIAVIQQTKPSFVVVLGDLLHDHEKIHTKVLNTAYDFIHKIRDIIPVYIIVGNHDYINNQQFLTSNHWMNAMKEWDNVTVVDAGHILNTRYGKFLFCPYVYPGRFVEALTIIDPDWKSARMIFCHQEIYGCKMGAIVSEDGDKWDLECPMLVSGHIHDKQRIQANVFYTGSSVQHAFGESPHKTISYCSIQKTIQLEKINLGLSSKSIVYASVNEMDDFDSSPAVDSNDQIRITLSGSIDEYKTFCKTKKYKELVNDNRIKIVYREKKLETSIPEEYINKPFQSILYDLIETTNCPVMNEIYKELVGA